jgi:hypothetical protein
VVALRTDEGGLVDPFVALAQVNAEFLGLGHQRHARLMQQSGIGGKGHCFVLHRGVHVDHGQ